MAVRLEEWDKGQDEHNSFRSRSIKRTQWRGPCIFAWGGAENVDCTVWHMTADMVILKEYIVGGES